MSYSETVTKEDLKNILNELLPIQMNTAKIGEIIAYAGSNEPLGWLKCDGRAVSRTTYSTLFAVIGTTYGSGDGSTTFNLPNLKGRTIVGVDPSDTSSSEINFSTLGSTKGSKYLQSHTHTLHGTYLYAGSAGSTYSFNTYTGSDTSTGSAGSGSSQNIQPSIVLNYLIYVGGDIAPITPSLLDDWVIEQGTSGIWTYRKWNSGIQEAWGYSSDSFAMTSGINIDQYYGSKSYSISALGFTAIHNIQITGGGGGAYFASKVESFNTSTINMSARASNTNTTTLSHWFYIKGTWK